MTDIFDADSKTKKERSPSFPFIPLEKAVWRAGQLLEGHKREAARMYTVGATWGYAPRSSGLQQTVAALKQFGLVEDMGSGEDRKIQLTDLARRILMDQRPGARESGLQEAARSPRLIAEYIPRWVPDRPSDAHCLSELQLERGFTEVSANLFLRVFDDTVSYAGLKNTDSVSRPLGDLVVSEEVKAAAATGAASGRMGVFGFAEALLPKPFTQRLKIELTAKAMTVTATLLNKAEADTLIKMLQANMALLPEAQEKPI